MALSKMKFLFFCSISLLYVLTSNSFGLVAQITILPDTNVIVGEEVYFDAEGSTYDSATIYGRFEWDFGDGYAYKAVDYDTSWGGGTCCTHFFMKPGTFTVQLKVTDTVDNFTASAYKTIHVTGTTPMSGFELLHADFNSRIAQPIFIKLPQSIAGNNSYRITAYIKDSNGTKNTLFTKTGPNNLDYFLLKNSELSKGTHFLETDISNSNDSIVSSIKEKIVKQYDGIPKVGINENNAICINGTPFFPVNPFIINPGDIPAWKSNGCANSVYGAGWYPNGNILSTWEDYLNQAQMQNMWTIGPLEWDDGLGPVHYVRNSNITTLKSYLSNTKSSVSLLAWTWCDEPNDGGESQVVPSPTIRGWTYLSHLRDPQHPVTINYGGEDYLPGNGSGQWNMNHYDYYGDDSLTFGNFGQFGEKRNCPVDIIGLDIYPIEYSADDEFNIPNRGPIDLYAAAIDNMLNRNFGLFPALSYIETNDINGDGNPAPTPTQLRMEIWLNVVHGIKGISWFIYFSDTPLENFKVMAQFTDQITRLTPIVLGPKSLINVTKNANTRGNRVDVLVKEDESNIYVFAVRITEPPWEYSATNFFEPESINVSFSIDSVKRDKDITVFDESRVIKLTNGTFSDVFNREAVHIYKILKDNAGVKYTGKKTDDNRFSIKGHGLYTITANPHTTIAVYSLSGKLIERLNFMASNTMCLDLRNKPEGIFILRTNNTTINTRKIYWLK